MKALMWPAIKFMSQLGYAAKFGLISLLFMVPLIVLSGQVFFSAFDSLTKTNTELEGLAVTQALIDYADRLEEFRNLAPVVFFQNSTSAQNLKENVHNVEKNLPLQLASLQKKIDSPELHASIEQWKKESFIFFDTGSHHRQPTFIDQFRLYQRVIDEFYIVIAQHNQRVGISLDADADIQRLINILNGLASIKHVTGLVHGIGVYSFIEQYLQSPTFDMVNSIYDQLISVDTEVQLLISNAKAVDHTELSQATEKLNGMMEQLRIKLDEDVIGAPYIVGEWQSFDAFYREQAAHLLAVENLVLPLIKSKLEERYAQQRSKIIVLVLVLLSALTIITYLYLAFFVSIRYSIKSFTETAAEVADGDFTRTIKFAGRDEMASLRDSFNDMVSNIGATLSAVKESAEAVSNNVNDVESIANVSRQAVQEQQEQTQQISRIISSLAVHAGQSASLAEEAEQAAYAGHQKTEESGRVVSQVMVQVEQLSMEMAHSMEAVNRLAANSDSISSILETIKNIAEQTNLLALNAAIEAARAGEHGRGFAVVADEVRTLASRSQDSAQEIEGLIKEVQNNIVNTVSTMESNRSMIAQTVEQSSRVTETLAEVQHSIDDIRGKTTAIAATSNEQQQNAINLENNLEQIRLKSQQTADNAEETVAEVRKTQKITDALSDRVAHFKVE